MSLLDTLSKRPEDILLPNTALQKDALLGLKEALDTVAPKYSALDSVHVDGLKADQVWVQAQMVLEGVTMKLNDAVDKFADSNAAEGSESEDDSSDSLSDEVAEDGDELSGDSQDETNELDVDAQDAEDSDAELDLENMHDDYEESDVEEEPQAQPSSDESDGESKPKDDNFDLAEFQQHVLQLEQDNEDGDDEDVDYFAELDDPSDDADMHYEDFFGPAPKRARKEKKKVTFASSDDNDDNAELDEAGIDDAMETTRKDLFDEDEDDMEAGPSGSERNMSNFERQQLELSRQIEELENENVGEKEWGMKGEAQAKDRPEDSLFNIQFDRNVKPAPVITTEATESIEDLIRERIRKQQFDDIPRRSELAESHAKRELPELSDAKSQKSLAELYEEDQMRQENPEYYKQQDSAVLDAAHREIVDLFTSVSRKLDSLCSWQYTPRPATPSLTVVSDSPSISMEEAQPGTLAPEAQLAPQEIYKGEAAVPMDNQEMSTSLKRKKRRDKAKAKSGRSNVVTDAKSGSASSKRNSGKEEMFSTLKRGNVTLVDKRGNKRDMRGQEVKDKSGPSAAQVKL